MSRELVKGAKRTSYDADTRRLTSIMPDHASAASWHVKTILFRGKRLQMLCPATLERDDVSTPLLPATSLGRHHLHYQVRVLVNGVAGKLGSSYFGVQCFLCGDICDSWMLTRIEDV